MCYDDPRKGRLKTMSFWQKVLRVMDTSMDTPQAYGWFHLLWIALAVGAAVALCMWHRRNGSDRSVIKVVFGVAVTVLVLEIYKLINFSFSYENGISFDFAWGSFPWQFCSTPMYVGLLTGVIRKGKIHECLCAYLATYALFAGLAVMVYPGDVFISTAGINIQTMFCHGSMITVAIYLLGSGYVKLEHRTILKAIPVFAVMLGVAMVMNEIAYHKGLLETDYFNMFYISPYCNPHLPVYSQVQQLVAYPLELVIYIAGFTLAAYLMLLIGMGAKTLFKGKTRSLAAVS